MSADGDAPKRHWFEDLADHMRGAYLRYSFTMGTDQECDFLVAELGLVPGSRVLDIGCGPGRHANALAERGMIVVGVDISESFVDVANENRHANATFLHGDARNLVFDREFDAVISLCQGGFGLCGPQPGTEADDPQLLRPDLDVLDGVRRALRPGGRFALSAFSAYFQLKWLEETDGFDATNGMNHERTEVLDADRRGIAADLWTTCYTPRELRLLADRSGLIVENIYSVEPGSYQARKATIESHEFLVVGHTPR